jgi:hypothetical protein
MEPKFKNEQITDIHNSIDESLDSRLKKVNSGGRGEREGEKGDRNDLNIVCT